LRKGLLTASDSSGAWREKRGKERRERSGVEKKKRRRGTKYKDDPSRCGGGHGHTWLWLWS
jgi:hypothetical protein